MHENTKNISIGEHSSLNIWDYENSFYWFSHPTRINKLLAQFELYKKIIHLPGHVFELGVYKAASLIRLATFRNLLENNFSRQIVGFDAFGAFPQNYLSLPEDKKFVEKFEQTGGEGLSVQEVQTILNLKRFENIELIEGNIFDTLPNYLQSKPEARICFLHLDMDVKEPTAFALQHLYDRVVPNGLIVLDDYNSVAGATEAVDEFVAKKNLLIEKLPHYYIPSFIKKPA